MRGDDLQQGAMFSYLSPEQRVPADHPLRSIRQMVDTILKRLSPRFEAMYAERGRPSIPPEKLLRALLLPCLYSVRSERLLMEQLDYNLLFRWFVGLNMDDPVWHFTVFSQNRERLLKADVARAFFEEVGQLAREKGLLSDEHFTVDGTLIEAWAGQKSFKPRPPGDAPPPPDSDSSHPTVNFRGQKRRNDTHASTTDPDARLYKKADGQEAKLAFLGHVLMENRNGLVVQTRLTRATGTAEREASLEMLKEKRKQKEGRLTVGGDKNYDVAEHVAALRQLKVTPHVAQNTARRGGSAIDQRTTRHPGYSTSQTKRKRVEEIMGWVKTVGLMRKTRFRGLERVGWIFTWTAAAYNLIRIRNLIGARA
jgi:transposase